jgi:hydroxypyruvate isomerase
MPSLPNRRTALKNLLASTAAVGATGALSAFTSEEKPTAAVALKGNINHSVCRWCYQDIPLEQLCTAAKSIGIKGIDLVGPADWPTLKKYGLDSPMCNGAEINLTDGFNNPQFHATLQKNYAAMIPRVADAGYRNLICFSGNRRGKTDATGLANCVQGLTPLLELAAKHNVVLVMELLNSKINHKDYQCDRTFWAWLWPKIWAPTTSGCFTTSTTCRLTRAMSSARLPKITPTLRTTTPAACPAATKSTTRRN